MTEKMEIGAGLKQGQRPSNNAQDDLVFSLVNCFARCIDCAYLDESKLCCARPLGKGQKKQLTSWTLKKLRKCSFFKPQEKVESNSAVGGAP